MSIVNNPECMFTHTGGILGESASSDVVDGVTIMALPLTERGVHAVAGMIWDKSDDIGPQDASVLLEWLQSRIGPWPNRRPTDRDQMILEAKSNADAILSANSEAVMAVADVIERETSVWNGGRLKKVAATHMTMPPSVMPLANHVWRSAVRGNRIAEVAVGLMGLTAYLAPVRKEMGVTLKSRAAL